MTYFKFSASILILCITWAYERSSKPVSKSAGRPHGNSAGDACVWARPGMNVTFRAEVMPGREASQRTFRVAHVLPSHRVILDGMTGEHTEREFELARRSRLNARISS